jgi:hypothetical protein
VLPLSPLLLLLLLSQLACCATAAVVSWLMSWSEEALAAGLRKHNNKHKPDDDVAVAVFVAV